MKGYESIDNSWLKYYPEKEKSTKRYCLLLGLQGKICFSKKKWLTNILRMATAVADEFFACDKFVNNLEHHYRHIDCSISHPVSYEKFKIFINYNDSSVNLIEKEMMYIKKSLCW